MTFPAQLARTGRFTFGAPSRVTTVGPTTYFLRSGALWSQADGAERRIADDVSSYAAVPGLIVYTSKGRVHTVRPAGETQLDLPTPVTDPRPDPTGTRIAYVHDGALHVDGTPIATPDGPDVTFGLAEYVARASIGRDRGYWWSPDGQRLLVARVDESKVQRWHLADPADPATPARTIRYPSAGTANAEVTLWITDLDGRRTAVDTRGMEYVTAAGWDAFGPYAAVQSRDQRHVQVLGIDPGTGETEVLSEQRDPDWVRLVPGLPARSDSGVLFTSADVDDTRTLLADGKPVTPPGLQLEAVVSVTGESVLFRATDEPTESHLWTYDGDVRRSPGPKIASHAERPELELRMEMYRLGDKQLRAALFLPSWWDGGPLPVLMDPYGGPALRKVTTEPDWWHFVSQWFAEQGFAVLAVDGRGTPGRGPAWERAIVGDLAGPVIEDQVEGLHLLDHPALDRTRVGIRGWSFGGYLAAMAVLRRPDVFHAAVAGAPVTDQRLYDTHFRERHLGHPAEHPEAYDRSSPLLEAAALTRPLLLIHGLADDNVVAAHTLRMSAALLAAGRPHETLLLPATSHRATQEHLLTHQAEFLRRSLGLPAQ